MPNLTANAPNRAVLDKLVRLNLFSDGFCLKSSPKEIPVGSRRITDTFWLSKGIASSDPVKKLVKLRGFKTSPRGSSFDIVIIPGDIFSAPKDLSNRVPGFVYISDVAHFAKKHGLRTPPPEIAYHLCLRADCASIARRIGVRKLIVMSEPFPDHNGFPSLWTIDFTEATVDEGSEVKTRKKERFESQKEKELSLGNSAQGGIFFENDGFVFLSARKPKA
jgi:hypothetical protein